MPASAIAKSVGSDSEIERQRLITLDIERFKWEQEVKHKEGLRYDAEFDMRRRELQMRDEEQQLRRQEIARNREKDARESEIRNSVASKIKLFGDAFRNAAFKMSNEPIELIPFFNNVERLFKELAVTPELRVPLLRPYLTDKAKSILVRLDATLASDYDKVKQYLLHEFALTISVYLEKFNSLSRQQDETYVLFCSRLKSLIDYYVDSRSATDFDSLISLLVSDRIKSTLSSDCLKYILSIEAATDKGWLPNEKLVEKIDVYLAKHWCDKPLSGTIGKTSAPSHTHSASRGDTKVVHINSSQERTTGYASSQVRQGRSCFRCKSTAHLIKDCPIKSNGPNHAYSARVSKVNRCAITPTVDDGHGAPSGHVNHYEFTDTCKDRPSDAGEQLRPPIVDHTDLCETVSSVLHTIVSTINETIEISDNEKHTDNNDFSKLQYMDIVIPELSGTVISSLSDSGAEVCVIKSSLLNDCNIRPIGRIKLRGVIGQPVDAAG